MLCRFKAMFFATLLCVQPLLSNSTEPKPQQLGWVSCIKAGWVTVGALFTVNSLRERYLFRTTSEQAKKLAPKLDGYLAGARTLLIAQHGNKKTLVEKEESFFYEHLSSDIRKALSGQEPISPALVSKVETCMKENGGPGKKIANHEDLTAAQSFLVESMRDTSGKRFIDAIDKKSSLDTTLARQTHRFIQKSPQAKGPRFGLKRKKPVDESFSAERTSFEQLSDTMDLFVKEQAKHTNKVMAGMALTVSPFAPFAFSYGKATVQSTWKSLLEIIKGE